MEIKNINLNQYDTIQHLSLCQYWIYLRGIFEIQQIVKYL